MRAKTQRLKSTPIVTVEHEAWEAEEILAGIDQIDWAAMRHAFGVADNIPDLLRLMLAHDAEVREGAFDLLSTSIWHHGVVYEASAATVPFLLRLLTKSYNTNREAILWLLALLATGRSYLASNHREGDYIFDLRVKLAREGRDFDAELEQELEWVRATNAAIGQGTQMFLSLLYDENLCWDALYVLAALRSQASVIVPRLCAMLCESNDQAFRAEVLWALDHLTDRGGETLTASVSSPSRDDCYAHESNLRRLYGLPSSRADRIWWIAAPLHRCNN